MKKKLILFSMLGALAISLFFGKYWSVSAQEEDLDKKEKEIEELQAKLEEIQGQKLTLSKTINYINTKIQLTQKQIENTQAEIKKLEAEVVSLTGKIEILDTNLETLTNILVNRINTAYKKAVSTEPMYLLLTSDGLSEFLKRYKYLKVGQKHDRKVMYELEQARANFDEQKKDKEDKQVELEKAKKKLEGQKTSLAQQQKEKQILLQVTRNDEKKYQELLATARAEYEAIQGIIAGKGVESKVGEVKEGDKIASIIQGRSCNSNGTHLHFMVSRRENKQAVNPFNYLKSGIDHENCSGEGACSAADEFNPTGSWNWPIEAKVRLTQGYGVTWATQNDPIIKQIYSFHNGIDINSLNSSSVKAVQEGTLYRGSYNVGCSLRYVRVEQSDGIDTYYLHINY